MKERRVQRPSKVLVSAGPETQEENEPKHQFDRDGDLCDSSEDAAKVDLGEHAVVECAEFSGCKFALVQSHSVRGDNAENRSKCHDPESADLNQYQNDDFAERAEL